MGACLAKPEAEAAPQHKVQQAQASVPAPVVPNSIPEISQPSQKTSDLLQEKDVSIVVEPVKEQQVAVEVNTQPEQLATSVPVSGPVSASLPPQPPRQDAVTHAEEAVTSNGVHNTSQGTSQPYEDGSQPATLAMATGISSSGHDLQLSAGSTDGGGSGAPVSTWDKAKMLFSLTKVEELLSDLHDLKYIGAGGYGKVFKAVWRSAPVAVKLVPSHSPELFKSSSYKEALLCKELCHPNIVQTYETRCAQLTDEFIHSILVATETPLSHLQGGASSGLPGVGQSNGSQEFVSGDGFGLPSPVPDMLVQGKTLPEAAAKWKDILFTTGAKAGDYLTVIIMDFCDYGSLVRPIVKGMFRPFSASGSDREARVRYRALLRTAKEIAQGLEHLHHLRVVHGDLKPGNVLLKGSRVDVRGFNAQVIDFGLSHMVQNSNPQKVSKAGGTLVYAAPEVFSGRVGKAADVYSLGIILWEMVTGSQPYKDLVEGQIVLGVQKGGLRPAWPPGQLPQLQELYEKCVAQDPDSRPKAKEVVQFLTQIEMDLRAELRAAHKQQQQMQQQAAQVQQQMQHAAALQQAEQHQRLLAAQQAAMVAGSGGQA